MKKKACFILLSVFMLVLSAAFIHQKEIQAETVSRDGEVSKKIVYISTLGELLSYTYDIYNTESSPQTEFKSFHEYILILSCDLDLNIDTSWHEYAPDWEQYGWYARGLDASLEGGGYTIKNLWAQPDINDRGPRSKIGLFGNIKDCFIRNLKITYDNSKMIQRPSVISNDRLAYTGYYGGLSIESENVKISNVHIRGNFYLGTEIGGIVALPNRTIIDNSTFEGDLIGGGVGGIVGISIATSVKNCLFKGSVAAGAFGGIAERPRGHEQKVEFINNVAIVVALEEIDIGIFNENYRPWGTFFGLLIDEDMKNLELSNNYVLDIEEYPHATKSMGNQEQIGYPTTAVNFLEEEVFGLQEFTQLSNPDNFPGLDFVNHWRFDSDGYPKLKSNFVSIINLTEDKFSDNFNIKTQERYYEADEVAKVESVIWDRDTCQLIYFTLDGQDMLQGISPNSLHLFMNSNHILIVKASTLCTVRIVNLEYVFDLKMNDKVFDFSGNEQQFKCKLGEKLSFSFKVTDGFQVNEILTSENFEFIKTGDNYSITVPKSSILETPTIDIVLNITELPKEEVPRSNLPFILSCVIGGILILGATGTWLFYRFRVKNKKN